MRSLLRLAAPLAIVFAVVSACSASGGNEETMGPKGSGAAGGDGGPPCDYCTQDSWVPCNADKTAGTPVKCAPGVCAAGKGCVSCLPGSHVCVGNEVHKCAADGKSADELIETCDVANGMLCGNGKCGTACEVVAGSASNVGCEFWAVDLDQQDAYNDPASAPWGVVLSNAGQTEANVTIELNEAPVGQPLQLKVVTQVSVKPNDLQKIVLPTRELDCGVKPNDYKSPGTCLSSRAYRITSSAPIIVYQFNVFTNSFSNDASLLLPTNALGRIHRVIGWVAGHPVPINFPGVGLIVDRSFVTVVGTKPGTNVTIRPTWRIKGNAPIPAAKVGEDITVTIGPFDVLNVETDDATMKDDMKTVADLSGTIVLASEPVAVFSGVETTQAPAGVVDVPTYSGWSTSDTCCLDHLEDQMFPVESIGKNYVITRSPIRSTSGFREPDVLRFMGVAETAVVTTNLPAPYDSFTIQPGEIKTTWAQYDVVVTSDKPVMVGQILISNQYVDGPYIGDPSLTVYPPVEQYRTEYVILTPQWAQSWVVIAAEVGASVTLDGATTTGCIIEQAGTLNGVTYESRRCQLQEGVHRLSGDKPFGIVAYGYGSAGSYAFAGGADVKRIYDPPPLK
jgi:hypothetical protein